MIKDSKFLQDNDDDMPEGYINLENINIASWMWESLMETSDATYDIVSVEVNGIIEFLNIEKFIKDNILIFIKMV